MDTPLISILSPAYNVSLYLPQYFESLFAQTYYNLQMVLIDDGSSDNTWEVMQKYAKKDSRIEVYHQENSGVAVARNELLKHVKGDYFLFIDSDDWIEPNMVEFLFNHSGNGTADIVMCKYLINDAVPSKNALNVNILNQKVAIRDFLRHEYFKGSLCNKLIKANLIQNETFHPEISYGEDALFCWHILQKSKIVVVTDKQLYHYRMNDSSISHSSFGSKKLSGYLTWSIISQECEQWWPEYTSIVKGYRAVNATHLLHNAARCGYKDKEQINILQQTIKDNFKFMVQNKLSSPKWYLYAWTIARCYKLGKFL